MACIDNLVIEFSEENARRLHHPHDDTLVVSIRIGDYNTHRAYLSSPPLLSPSKPGEELVLYLAVSSAAVSTALVREEDKVQKPVYFTSQALQGAEERYPPMEKLAFSLYRPRIAIKGQVIADFIVEFTHMDEQGAGENPQWMVHANGSSNKHAGRVGIVLRSPKGDEVECIVRLDFPRTNNEAKYEPLIIGLDLVQVARATNVIVHCDSQVVTSQINGGYECRREWMKEYLEQVKNRMNNFNAKFVQIPKEENE
ncbi:uncharacterized protein LOC142634863 [Castanea sativa]|uniref:uncharacterized protein LOC142634863 n=1 Tax=Castanea sativa TaxID=21020 RepID=UPI003F650E08